MEMKEMIQQRHNYLFFTTDFIVFVFLNVCYLVVFHMVRGNIAHKHQKALRGT